jgi:fatty-acyl-CoA synthase
MRGLMPRPLLAASQDKPTLTLVVPAVMKALLEHPDWASHDLSSLRAVWAGSSTLPQALVDAFHARGLPVCNVYGATETGPFSIALDERHAMTHAGSCGWPAPGVTGAAGNPKDGVGELLLRGPNVVQHYWPRVPAVDARAGSTAATWRARRPTAVGASWAAPRT